MAKTELAKPIMAPTPMEGKEPNDVRPPVVRLVQQLTQCEHPHGSLWMPSIGEVVYEAPNPFKDYSFPPFVILHSRSVYHRWSEVDGQPPVYMYKTRDEVLASDEWKDDIFNRAAERNIDFIVLFSDREDPVVLNLNKSAIRTAQDIQAHEDNRARRGKGTGWHQLTVTKLTRGKNSWFGYHPPTAVDVPDEELLRAIPLKEAVLDAAKAAGVSAPRAADSAPEGTDIPF